MARHDFSSQITMFGVRPFCDCNLCKVDIAIEDKRIELENLNEDYAEAQRKIDEWEIERDILDGDIKDQEKELSELVLELCTLEGEDDDR